MPNRKCFVQALGYVGNEDNPEFDPYSVSLDSLNTPFELDMKVVLGGVYDPDSNRMVSMLAEKGLLPLSQPFSGSPWNYTGTESVAAIPSNDIADWVLLELRRSSSTNTADETTIAYQGAYFLKEDGSIVQLDGSSLPEIQFDNPGSSVAILYSRHHLPIVSGDTLSINGDLVYSIDFTASTGAWYATSSTEQSDDGIFMSSSGQSTSDGTNYQVDVNSYNQSWSNRNVEGYNPADVDMDGVVTAKDRAAIFSSNAQQVTLPNQGNNGGGNSNGGNGGGGN